MSALTQATEIEKNIQQKKRKLEHAKGAKLDQSFLWPGELITLYTLHCVDTFSPYLGCIKRACGENGNGVGGGAGDGRGEEDKDLPPDSDKDRRV